MSNFNKDLISALLNQENVTNEFQKGLEDIINDLLEAEITAFLGYDPYSRNGWNTGNSRNGSFYRKVDTQFGQLSIKVPRDRNGDFHQQTIPSRKQHSDTLESMVIKMYSNGMTTRDIADVIEKMYGSHYSPAQVSNISKQLIPKVEEYHKRKLDDKFFCVFLDATYIPLRRDTVAREAVYVAIGIKPDGHKEVLDFTIAPTETTEVWAEMLQNFKQRGLKQVELFLSDGFVGIKSAIGQTYPQAHFQRCLIHIARNIGKKVRKSDREEISKDFKKVHQQVNKEDAEKVLQAFFNKWESRYSRMIQNVKDIQEDMLVFYNYPKEIRPSIYSTNAIESFNDTLKLKTKGKVQFPTEQSLDTFVGIRATEYNNRLFNRVHRGFGQVQDQLEEIMK